MPSGLSAGELLGKHGLRRTEQKTVAPGERFVLAGVEELWSNAMATQGVQHELILSRRMARLGTETAFEVLSKAKALERKGRNIVHLEIGEPDFATPPHIVDAAVDALRGGWTHYGPSAGLPELREAIANYVSRTRGVPVEPDEVVVVPGGKPIMFYAMLALVDEGDEVIYPNPGFPIYESMIRYAGGTPVPIPLREERDFAMDVDEMASLITPSTKLIILNSPQNPTGGVLARDDIERAAAAIGDRNILVLADEIYSRLQFEGRPFSIMSLPGMKERTILLDGFSKTYAMTGWRIGYGVMRADLAAQIARLMTNSNSCTASFTQRAALAALAGDQSAVDAMRLEFERRSRAFVAGLNRIRGFGARMPKGAFYVFANITGTGWASKPLADALLEEAGVAALSGTAFGSYGEGYLRFSVANSMENLMEALKRIDAWVGAHV
jgi:aspartate/methionine/tyrosine aminotransferase